jgi:hypothetical protein
MCSLGLALAAVCRVRVPMAAWTERPKTTLLERNEMFERAANDELNNHTTILVKKASAITHHRCGTGLG